MACRLAIHLAIHMRGAAARLQAAGLGHERKVCSVKVVLGVAVSSRWMLEGRRAKKVKKMVTRLNNERKVSTKKEKSVEEEKKRPAQNVIEARRR